MAEYPAKESYYETFSSVGEDFLESMAVRISDRFNGGDQRGRRMIDGARLDSDEMNLLTISTAGSKWRGEDDEDNSVMTRTTSEQMIPGARFNILGKMQMRKSSSSPVVQTPSPPPRSTRKNPTQHQQIHLEQLANLNQSDVCVKNERNNKGLLESCKSPLLSHDNNNNGSSNSDESTDSPLDFSISAKKSKLRLEEPQTEAPSSRLRNILSMKSSVIPENLQGTILNLSKESPNLAAATWSCPIKKSRMSSESRSGSSSCSPVPMDHHSSDFLPSSPTRAEVKGGITMKTEGGIPTTSSPLSVSTTRGVGAMGYHPYGAFSSANLSPVMNQTVPSVPLPLPYETSPPLLAHQVNGSSTSPNLPFGSALSTSLPASNGAAAKGRVTRPFKAYPKDPMSFSAIGLYGLPMGTSPGSTEALIHQQSNVAYAEFRKQMLSQTQSSRTRRGGQRNGSDSFNSSAGDAMNCNGNGSSNEDSHSANEDSGRSTSGKTDQQLKDEAYWERRRKNNEAAKRSRDARRAKEDEIAIRAAFLEQENLKLRFELCALKNETAKLRCMLYST